MRAGTPLRRRLTTWIALGLLVLGLVMVGFMLLSLVLPGSERLPNRITTFEDVIWTIVGMFAFLSLTVGGAVLAIRVAPSPIGWLLLVSGVSLIFGTAGHEYIYRSVILGLELPGTGAIDVLVGPMESVAMSSVLIWVPLLFPDGHLPGPRWRPIAWVAAIAMVTAFVGNALTVKDDWDRRLPNPFPSDGAFADVAGLLYDISNVVMTASIVLGAVSVIVRFRRSRGMERQQMKWFLAAVAVLLACVGAMVIVQQDWTYFLVIAGFGLVPIAIGIAVLRYRLYEIDRLISRTIGWALLTGLLVGAFALLVVGSGAALEPLTGGNTLAVAGSTLIVALLFAPLRRRVQRAVDRRFDRSRYDGERLVAALAERMRDEVDLGAIRSDILATVDAAVRPSSVRLWLRDVTRSTDRHAP